MARLEMTDHFFTAKALRWYKRRDVQEAILADCSQREVSPRFGKGFGKRPDALFYPADVLNMAKQKTTSFHCSEERWSNPLRLVTGSSRKELDALRVGWDLVLDIDCPYWLLAKLTAHLFVRALQDHGVRNVSVKFSGNKGFHVGVPFESFPATVDEVLTASLFPEGPRALATYLLEYIASTLIVVRENTLVCDGKYKVSYEKLKELTGEESATLVARVCKRCHARKEESVKREEALFLCASCGHVKRAKTTEEFLQCERCNGVMEAQQVGKNKEKCARCGGTEFVPRFNVQALIEVDTILLASRHLFRTPYSLHEKSGLVSKVFPTTEIMTFEKEFAKPENVKEFPKFLDASKGEAGEATSLLSKALARVAEQEQASGERKRDFAIPEEAIPEEYFPPCMLKILDGLEDGKKRSMFALTNFLRTCGWGHAQLAAKLDAWNKENPEPLREVTVKSHVRYQKTRKAVVPPPNCKRFYQDFGVCTPDALCGVIKNPAQYAKRKAAQDGFDVDGGGGKGEGRVKLTEEQKAMRKAYREKKKKEEQGK